MPVIGAASVIGDAPLSKAQEHNALADELRKAGDYDKAAQEHLKAAEGYLESVQYTQDARLQATLRRMHADQLKEAEDLRRRIAQRQRERERNPTHSSVIGSSRASARQAASGRREGYQSQSDASPSMTPPQSQSPRSSARRLQESTMSSGSESYTMLGAEFPEGFERFWNNIEGMVGQMMYPVAFASLPLDDTEKREPEDIGDIPDDSDEADVTRGRTGKMASAPTAKGPTPDFGSDDSDSDSFYIIPSTSSPYKRASASTTITPTTHVTTHNKQLQEENEKLGVEIEQMQAKVSKLENIIKVRAGQSAQLMESIMFAKREAQRNLVQSMTFRPQAPFSPMSPLLLDNAGNLATPIPSTAAVLAQQQRAPSPFTLSQGPSQATPNGNTTAQGMPNQQRIRELEEENRSLKVEVSKLKSQNNRFREKWATLKESARRKRVLRDQQTTRSEGESAVTEDVRKMSIKEEEEEDI